MIRKTFWLQADAANKRLPSTNTLKLHCSTKWQIRNAVYSSPLVDIIMLFCLDELLLDGCTYMLHGILTKAKSRIGFVPNGCKCNTGYTSNAGTA